MKSLINTQLLICSGILCIFLSVNCGSNPEPSQSTASDSSDDSNSTNSDEPSSLDSSESKPSSDSQSSGDELSSTDDNDASTSDNDASTGGDDDSMESTSDSGDEDSDSSESETGSEDTGDKKPLGQSCSENDECESDHCNKQLMGMGYCSECSTHEDCIESGTGISCAMRSQSHWTCEDGSISDHCDSEMNCKDDVLCGEVASVLSTCSHCKDDSDCNDGKLCGIIPPTQAWPHLDCVEAGSGQSGDMCRINESGEEFCAQHCGVSGFDDELGICGECRDDDDCEAGELCEPSSSANQFMGSECKPENDESSSSDESGETTEDTGSTSGTEEDTGSTGDTDV